MRRLEIMIVAGDGAFCRRLAETAAQTPEMVISFCTGSVNVAIEYLQVHTADIMFLETDLAEGDGLSLLDLMEQRALSRPLIMMLTDSGSVAVLQCIREHGVDYICQKGRGADSPQHLLDIAYRLYPYKLMLDSDGQGYQFYELTEEQSDVVTRRYIERELLRLGFRKKYVGFDYTAEAIELLMHRDTDQQVQITREIYPLVAKRYHATKEGVERGIRNAIQAAFSKVPDSEMRRYYPYSYDRNMGRPSNVDFLVNVSMHLTLD